jgi:LysM repeat protein
MRIVNKKRFITAIGVIAIIILIIMMLISAAVKDMPKYEENHKTIYVSKNETLWSIAEEYKKPNQDVREYIYEIKKINDMDNSIIFEGQELIIIVYEEVK